MAKYDFYCKNCQQQIEFDLPMIKASGKGIKCPTCNNGRLTRIYTAPNICSSTKRLSDQPTSSVSCSTGKCPLVS